MLSATRWKPGWLKAVEALGGTKVGGDLTPLGTVDFSANLIKAQAANPDVIVFLVQGEDMVNALKQAVQFGLQNKVHLAGAQQELEALEGLPPEARIGTWVMEWYWNQPGVPHVAEFVEAIKKRTGRVPTARTWFGFASTWTCALAAAKANSLKAVDMAKALQGYQLPPEIALGPYPAVYPRRPESAHGHPVRGQRASQGVGAGRSVQGHQARQGLGCRRDPRGDRLQNDLAGLSASPKSAISRRRSVEAAADRILLLGAA